MRRGYLDHTKIGKRRGNSNNAEDAGKSGTTFIQNIDRGVGSEILPSRKRKLDTYIQKEQTSMGSVMRGGVMAG